MKQIYRQKPTAKQGALNKLNQSSMRGKTNILSDTNTNINIQICKYIEAHSQAQLPAQAQSNVNVRRKIQNYADKRLTTGEFSTVGIAGV